MRRINVFSFTLALFFAVVPALAHGDKIVSQMADGAGVIRTKIDITNQSPDFNISRLKVLFFLQNGTPWSIETNRGTASEISLTLGRFQTIRIETRGTTPNVTAGYAIVRNTDSTSVFAEDFDVTISVFYEILSGPNVVDTVSVPLGLPTLVWILPVEIDVAKELLTGFAVVNLSDSTNKVTLRLWQATEPPTGDAQDGGQIDFTLNPKEQRAKFLNETGLFPNKPTFKGMMVGFSERPVAILALLQTKTPSGVQYATLAAQRLDSLRKNTYLYLRQGYALDADLPVIDYFFTEGDTLPAGYDNFTWDIRYETQTATTRRLVPQAGAAVAPIGTRTVSEFDALSLEELQSLSYSTNPIDMSDTSTNLHTQFAFAIKTGLGRYVKIRIGDVVTRDTTNRDLALETFVYK
jgi:hypothetical protein